MSESPSRSSCSCAICCKQDACESDFDAQLLGAAEEDPLPPRIHSPRSEMDSNRNSVFRIDRGDAELLRSKRAANSRFSRHSMGQGAVAFGTASRPYYQALDNQTSSGTTSSRSPPASPYNTFIQVSYPQTTPTPLAIQYTIQKSKRIPTSRSAPALGLCRVPTASPSGPIRQSATSRSDPGSSLEGTPFSLFNLPVHFRQRVTSAQPRNPYVTAIPLVASSPQATQRTESVPTSRSAPTPEIPRFPTSQSSPPIRQSASVTSSKSVPVSSLHDVPPSSSSPPTRLRRRAASVPAFTPPIQVSNPYATRATVIIPQAIQQSEGVATSKSAPMPGTPRFPSLSPPVRRSASVASSRSAPGYSLRDIPHSSSSLPIRLRGNAASVPEFTPPIQSSNPCATHAPVVIPQAIQQTESIATSRSAPAAEIPHSPTMRQSASVISSPPGLSLYSISASASNPRIHFPGRGASAQASNPHIVRTRSVIPQDIRQTESDITSRSVSTSVFPSFPASPPRSASASSPYSIHFSASGSPIHFPGEVASAQVFRSSHYFCFSVYLTNLADSEIHTKWKRFSV